MTEGEGIGERRGGGEGGMAIERRKREGWR